MRDVKKLVKPRSLLLGESIPQLRWSRSELTQSVGIIMMTTGWCVWLTAEGRLNSVNFAAPQRPSGPTCRVALKQRSSASGHRPAHSIRMRPRWSSADCEAYRAASGEGTAGGRSRLSLARCISESMGSKCCALSHLALSVFKPRFRE